MRIQCVSACCGIRTIDDDWRPSTGFGQYRGDLLVIPSGRGEYGGAPLMLDFTFSHTLCGTRVHQHRYHKSVNHTLKSLEAAKTKVYQQH